MQPGRQGTRVPSPPRLAGLPVSARRQLNIEDFRSRFEDPKARCPEVTQSPGGGKTRTRPPGQLELQKPIKSRRLATSEVIPAWVALRRVV